MTAPVTLLPPGLVGRKRHYALDAQWAATTDLAFARTMCGRRALLTPAGQAQYGLTPSMSPELCAQCAAAAGDVTSTEPVEVRRAPSGLDARRSGTENR